MEYLSENRKRSIFFWWVALYFYYEYEFTLNNIFVFEDMADLYFKTGQLDLAKNIAINVMNSVTSTAPQMQALLDDIAKQQNQVK